MFAGDFSQLLPSTIIYDPTTGLPFPGNNHSCQPVGPDLGEVLEILQFRQYSRNKQLSRRPVRNP